MTKILYIPSGEYVEFLTDIPYKHTVIYEDSIYTKGGISYRDIEDILIACYSRTFLLHLKENKIIYDKNCFEILYD